MSGSFPPRLAAAFEVVRAIRARGRLAVVAGGAVRDHVLGRPLTDTDVATDIPLEDLAAMFTVHEVGRSKDFETVVVVRNGLAFEVSRLRTGRAGAPAAAGSGPPPAGFDPLREDTAHRDFTINALLMDPDGRVIDHQEGLEDLRNRIVRAVGSPEERFAEDPVRLLRAVRFASVLGFEIAEGTAAAISGGAWRLAGVAGERIGAEILKMASAPGRALAQGIELMDRFGLLRTVLPEVADLQGLEHPVDKHPEGGVYEHTLAALRASVSPDPAVNLAVLFHDVGKRPAHAVEDGRHRYRGHEGCGTGLADAIARRLFLPQRIREALLFAVEHHGECGRLAELRRSKRLALVGSGHWPVLRALALCDLAARGDRAAVGRFEALLREVERDAAAFAACERPAGAVISGDRIMALTGLAPGPRVGAIRRRVSEWALDNRVEDPARIEAEVLREASISSEGGNEL
jgi:tRNA nucleotidyltransferase/poly(A) polymerase